MEKDLSTEFIAIAHRLNRINMDGIFPDLSKGEFCVLSMIHDGYVKGEAEGVYVSHIANYMKVTPSAISRMLRGLEKRGLIERKVDKNDRRNIYVCLTDEGNQMRQKVEVRTRELTQGIVAAMGEEDAHLLITLYNKMMDVMEVEVKKYTEKLDTKM